MIPTTRRFTPAPFQILRGSNGTDGRDGPSEKNNSKPDTIIYEGEIEGEVRTPPFITNWNNGISHDASSLTEIEGTQGKYWTRNKQELDFKITDTDGNPNLEVTVAQEFTGAGRLQIRNMGDHGGDGQIDFPVGDLSKNYLDVTSLAYEHERASEVRLQKDADSAKIEVVTPDGTKVYSVKDGLLVQQRD